MLLGAQFQPSLQKKIVSLANVSYHYVLELPLITKNNYYFVLLLVMDYE